MQTLFKQNMLRNFSYVAKGMHSKSNCVHNTKRVDTSYSGMGVYNEMAIM